MKKFSAFLSEAKKSFAAQDAEKLGLKHVGYGNYADPAGNVTHRSVDGRLVKMSADEINKQQNGSTQDTGEAPAAEDQGSIAITFGRFNPPTVGHEKLLNKVKTEAKGGEYRIYPSQSQDPKKNPLSPNEKIKYMKLAYPEYADAISTSPELRTIFDVLKVLNDEGYGEVKIVVGGDRVSEFNSLAQKYNGDLYQFENILVVSAGDRDPDAEDVSGMSASKLRAAAAEDDFNTFKSGISSSMSLKDKESLYKSLRNSMQLESNEDFCDASFNLHEIAPRLDPQGVREAYFENNLFQVGTFIENINTGVIGKVVSRGANYIIYIDERETVFRSWLKDLVERNDIKYFDFTPAGEMGTDKLANYMRKLTPGEFIRKINKKDKDA
ncbi:cytitidyltransferase [Synechococcus phage S-MbCM6]|uniref:Cytitidyltransferase n=3 Tax=Namakavirus smbcm6 TaxID=2734120 RepID=H8ZMS6_9CAUD|nr:cytidyltransferase [Synechococcus phage ACG-2014c]AHB80798.1 ribonucleotide reductase A [Synechococcus phage S-MbCM25]AFD02787.1 NrdB ribonucleotide reductase A [Synechococcus phage ACG-2014c]AIX14559.1 cytitidyltransferase [Synechococcus phage ACG-2014c]AIX22716.1 cytitidyltransferase [Synechococcus phage ACG-2014c]AIX22931.1 cytitidyltransferase [Synechococcus phage ACG-2014c]